jgi:hypothetical protein
MPATFSAVRRRDQRAKVGIGVLGVADDDLAHHLADAGDEVVVELAGHDRTRRGGAVLPGVDQ